MPRKYAIEIDAELSREEIDALYEELDKTLLDGKRPLILMAGGSRIKEIWLDGPATFEGERLAKMYEAAVEGDEVSRNALVDFLKEKGLVP